MADSLALVVERCRAGDPAARDQLLTRLRPYLHAVVARRLGAAPGGVDPSSVVQQSLIRVAAHLGDLREPDAPHLLRWAARIATNLIADHHRRPAAGALGDHDPPAPAADPAHGLEQAETAVRVAAALARLPDHYRRAVELRYVEQLPDAEAAAALGTTPGALRVLRLRALRALKPLLEEP